MILLTPGPVQVKKEILNIALEGVVFHRSATFENIFKNCAGKIKIILGADNSYTSLILAGSGTMAIEAFAQSVVDPKDRVLIISNGHFGNRLRQIIEICDIASHFLNFGYGNRILLETVETEIRKFKPKWLMAVAHETSSGMINPVFEIGQLCKEYGVCFMVDAVSAVGGMRIDVKQQNIDACVSVPNKGLEGLPGVSFICIKTKHLESSLQSKTFYLDLKRYYKFSERNQMPVTPAIQSVVAFDSALNFYIEEGFEKRKERFETLSRLTINFAKEADLKVLVTDEELRFPGVVTIITPNGISVKDLHKYLFKKGFVVWFYEAGKETEGRNLFQISVMGDVKDHDIKQCFRHITDFLKQNE